MVLPKSGRSGVVVEPMLTDQWFVKMAALAKDGLEVVKRGEVRFVPEHWTATYNHWLENIQDWNISRQLWWGHQIPAWYDEEGKIYVARTEAELQKKYPGRSCAATRTCWTPGSRRSWCRSRRSAGLTGH